MTLKGIEGAEKIQSIMENLRKNPPKKLGDWDVLFVRDYEADQVLNQKTGEVNQTGLPKSNVLYFDLSNDSWCCARPSGTEPKLKFYMGIKGESLEDADKKLEELTKAMMDLNS